MTLNNTDKIKIIKLFSIVYNGILYINTLIFNNVIIYNNDNYYNANYYDLEKLQIKFDKNHNIIKTFFS